MEISSFKQVYLYGEINHYFRISPITFLLEEMSFISLLVWFNIIIKTIVNNNDVGRVLRLLEALPHDLEGEADAAVQGRQVRLEEDWGHRVTCH